MPVEHAFDHVVVCLFVDRKNAAVGYLCCPLLPVCLLLSSDSENILFISFAMGAMIISVAACGWTMKVVDCNIFWVLAMMALSVASVVWISCALLVCQLTGKIEFA